MQEELPDGGIEDVDGVTDTIIEPEDGEASDGPVEGEPEDGDEDDPVDTLVDPDA